MDFYSFASYKIVCRIVGGEGERGRGAVLGTGQKLCLMFLMGFRADELRDFLLSDECYSAQLSLLLSLRRLPLE